MNGWIVGEIDGGKDGWMDRWGRDEYILDG